MVTLGWITSEGKNLLKTGFGKSDRTLAFLDGSSVKVKVIQQIY